MTKIPDCRRFISLAIALILSLPYIPASAAPSCARVLSPVESEGKYLDFKYRIIANPKNRSASTIFPDYNPDDLMIGVSLSAHSYFMVGSRRFDGELGLGGYKPYFGWGANLSRGVVLRFKNLPPDLVARLRGQLESEFTPDSPTCSAGVCNYLAHNGIEAAGPIKKLFPTSVIGQLLSEGLVLPDGKVLKPELVVIGAPSFEKLLFKMRMRQALISSQAPLAVLLNALKKIVARARETANSTWSRVRSLPLTIPLPSSSLGPSTQIEPAPAN